jgi:hypothetical protein
VCKLSDQYLVPPQTFSGSYTLIDCVLQTLGYRPPYGYEMYERIRKQLCLPNHRKPPPQVIHPRMMNPLPQLIADIYAKPGMYFEIQVNQERLKELGFDGCDYNPTNLAILEAKTKKNEQDRVPFLHKLHSLGYKGVYKIVRGEFASE